MPPLRSRFFGCSTAVADALRTGETKQSDSSTLPRNDIGISDSVSARKRKDQPFRIWGKRSTDLRKLARESNTEAENCKSLNNLGRVMRQFPCGARDSWEDAVRKLSESFMHTAFPGCAAMSDPVLTTSRVGDESHASSLGSREKIATDVGSGTYKALAPMCANRYKGSASSGVIDVRKVSRCSQSTLAGVFSEFCNVSVGARGQFCQRLESAEHLFDACVSMSAPSAIRRAAVQVLSVEVQRISRSLACRRAGSRYGDLKRRLDSLQERLCVHAHIVYGIAGRSKRLHSNRPPSSKRAMSCRNDSNIESLRSIIGVKTEDASAQPSVIVNVRSHVKRRHKHKRRHSDADCLRSGSCHRGVAACVDGQSAIANARMADPARVKRSKTRLDSVDSQQRLVLSHVKQEESQSKCSKQAEGYSAAKVKLGNMMHCKLDVATKRRRLWKIGRIISSDTVVDLDANDQVYKVEESVSAQRSSAVSKELEGPSQAVLSFG